VAQLVEALRNKPEGRGFDSRRCRTAAIQQRVTAVLLSIPNEAFADSFQKLYERCQPCFVKDDYFEGNKVNLFVSSVLFSGTIHRTF
jgi:hypothetical protein